MITPDMLEVGRVMAGDRNWNRAHFGAWVVTSSPLILGMDLQNNTIIDSVIEFVTNPEAIAVNQVQCARMDCCQHTLHQQSICL
jgi:hypothetical protein|eukprot:COSAG02_NODE_8148_length_2690_cov_1.258973_3_plen_84_part_00